MIISTKNHQTVPITRPENDLWRDDNTYEVKNIITMIKICKGIVGKFI